ncbi:hypothetical protein [Dactylosporangium sp. CA-092794]|uniref:hypothetical protein n=1 Tax=Dactylosporangium sp. CA-092794 TaxID=3239929 RepID=UPI003D91050E
MDGHWEWSEGGDDADTADLGGDGGHDLHGDFGDHYGTDAEGGDYGTGADGDHYLHGEYGGAEGGEHLDVHHGGDDLEEPLGTEHATAEYDEALHHDPDPGYDESAHDPAGADLHDDAQHDVQAGEPEAAFGTDPDIDAHADDPAWHDVQFPEELHLQDPPQPVDGFPWTDADVLGGPGHDLSAAYDPAGAGPAAPEPGGLADYAGVDVPPGTDPWSLLLGSDDPAASSLATFWAPQ